VSTPHRVLLVDDADDLRMLVRMLLERTGLFEVVGEASDGQAGITEAGVLQPDLVLLDLAMPVLDGLSAAPRIREAAPDARIVVLTGFDERVVPPGLPIDGLLTKGNGFDRLAERLTEILGA
jgi:DNA-binding NarL/FixJ family response regulator